MEHGPLTETELEWLDDVLLEYGNDASVLDVSELDGMLTAILSGPDLIPPSLWLTDVWGGEKRKPRWSSEHEAERFMTLVMQHMNDIAERLQYAPEQLEPMFGFRDIEGQECTVVEEWCFGYMRGVALAQWPALPAEAQAALDTIALHGDEDNFTRLDEMTGDEYIQSIDAIPPAVLKLHRYWLEKRRH